MIFIYDGAPAHNNPAIPGPNSELKKLPPYSPFLNIVEQARTGEQQSRGKTTRNRVRQLPHSIATSGPAEKHTYIPRCLNNEEIEG